MDGSWQLARVLNTYYTYDLLNHVTQVSMPRSTGTQTRTFTYNNTAYLQSATNPENGTVNYTYNADGTLALRQNSDLFYLTGIEQEETILLLYPDADAEGFVAMPNVDTPSEMVDMLSASRAYQANLTAISLIRELVQKALELGK